MAKVFYSMAGEGRGHAVRVRSVVEALRGEHEIVLFAPDEAYDFLAPKYAGTEIEVRKIPCLRFHYRNRKLDYFQTAVHGARYLRGLSSLIRDLAAVIRKEKPDVIVTDFEPALPRAARRVGVPFVVLNHQHFLVVSDLSALPRSLQLYAAYMSVVVGRIIRGNRRRLYLRFLFHP